MVAETSYLFLLVTMNDESEVMNAQAMGVAGVKT